MFNRNIMKKSFEEFVDYKFLSSKQVKETKEPKHGFSYVAIKDTNDYSSDAKISTDDTARINRVCHLLVKSTDRQFVSDCVEHALYKHSIGMNNYQI